MMRTALTGFAWADGFAEAEGASAPRPVASCLISAGSMSGRIGLSRWLRTVTRSAMFLSSRTFPGHRYERSSSSVEGASSGTSTPCVRQ